MQMFTFKLCHCPSPPCMAYLINDCHDTIGWQYWSLSLYEYLMQLRPAFFRTGVVMDFTQAVSMRSSR